MSKMLCFLAIFSVFFTACKSSDDPTAIPIGGGNSSTSPMTLAQVAEGSLATWYSDCQAVSGMGAAVDGVTSFAYYVTFHSNNQYDFSVQFYTDNACGTTTGTEAFAYDQFGTFSLATSALDDDGATVIAFARGSEILTSYGATADGSTWAGYINSYCTGGTAPGLSTSATDSADPFGFICTHAGTAPVFTFPNFPNSGAATYNVGVYLNSGGTKTLTIAAPTDMWIPGVTTVPTSAGALTLHYL